MASRAQKAEDECDVPTEVCEFLVDALESHVGQREYEKVMMVSESWQLREGRVECCGVLWMQSVLLEKG